MTTTRFYQSNLSIILTTIHSLDTETACRFNIIIRNIMKGACTPNALVGRKVTEDFNGSS